MQKAIKGWGTRGWVLAGAALVVLGLAIFGLIRLVGTGGNTPPPTSTPTPTISASATGQGVSPSPEATLPPSSGPTPTASISTQPTVQPTFVPTDKPSSGPAQITVSVDGVRHNFAGTSGAYNWVGAYAEKSQTLFYTGNRTGMICVTLSVELPGMTFYGDNYEQTFFSNTPLRQGQVVVDPLGPYPTSYPVKNANWSTSFHFC